MEPPDLNPTAINNIPNQKPQTPTTPIHQTHEIGKLGQASRAFAAPSAFVGVVLGGVVSGLSKLYALATGKKEAPYQLEDATKHWTTGVALSIGLPLTLFSVACYTLSAKLHGNEVTTEGLYQNLTFFSDKFANKSEKSTQLTEPTKDELRFTNEISKENIEKIINSTFNISSPGTPSVTGYRDEFKNLVGEMIQIKLINSEEWQTVTISKYDTFSKKVTVDKEDDQGFSLDLEYSFYGTEGDIIVGLKLTEEQLKLLPEYAKP